MNRLFTDRYAAIGLTFFMLLSMGVRSPARAQGAQAALISGTILDSSQHPVENATVRTSGPTVRTSSTNSSGKFVFQDLQPGLYQIEISKAGFNPIVEDDVTVLSGNTTNVVSTLQATSLTSVAEIGRVKSSAGGQNSINTTPASIATVAGSTFADQGQLTVNQVLNEVPGVDIGIGPLSGGSGYYSTGGTGASPGIPSVRGGLPYETESLIDGHPISLGQLGTFSPTFLSPYLLQNVEIVKGSGATSPSINYAINGTINYRTLEPTQKTKTSIDFGVDQFGGNFANLRATGTLPGNHFSYAFDYVTQGTQGSDRGLSEPQLFFANGPTAINGVPFNNNGTTSFSAGPSSVYGSFQTNAGYIVCCQNLSMRNNERNELAKIRYNFSPSTAITATWLGGQANAAVNSEYLNPCVSYVFAPPAGYPGTYRPTTAFGGGFGQWLNVQNTNLFETEFHTPLTNTLTLQLRQYASSIQTFFGGPGDSGATAGGLTDITGAIYGGVDFGNSTVPTIFNGQIGTLSINQYFEQRSYNNLNGYTAELDQTAGSTLLSLSYDQEKTSTYATQDAYGVISIVVPRRSSQTFRSFMARAQFELGKSVSGTLSDNYGTYADVYTQDAGLSFLTATRAYQAPRLSVTWRPDASKSVRASVGTSIAPPYIALLNNNAIISPGTGAPPNFYTQTVNSGDVLPETAFGFDIGFDARLHSPYTIVSFDTYQTVLHNQFLQETSQQGTYTDTNPVDFAYGATAPLYVTKTVNLGHSKYEGIELSLHRAPPTGLGYRLQGSLQRAYAYDLPAGFYNTPNGVNTANLAVLPNLNFLGSGPSYNGLAPSPIPYSTGYGEINYRWKNGAHALLGATYYGSNNPYNEPAFGVVTLGVSEPVAKRASLQLTINNLTNAYPSPYFSWNYTPGNLGGLGISTPLVNGLVGMTQHNVVGPSTARLTLHIDL